MNHARLVDQEIAHSDAQPAETVLEINDLQTHFFTAGGVVRAVDGVSYAVRSHETLGVVGESGCGKSVTALSVLRLVADPPGRIVGGHIRFEGVDLLELTESEMEAIRGNDISMIFQEPMTSLNPLMTVGPPDRRVHRAAPGTVAARRLRPGGRDAAPGSYPGGGASRARLSAPALRRHAPTRDDRDGGVVQSQAA